MAEISDLEGLAAHYRTEEERFGNAASHLEEAIRLLRGDSTITVPIDGFRVGDRVKATLGTSMGREGRILTLDFKDETTPFEVLFDGDEYPQWKNRGWIEKA